MHERERDAWATTMHAGAISMDTESVAGSCVATCTIFDVATHVRVSMHIATNCHSSNIPSKTGHYTLRVDSLTV